jgi:hypothetical protein
MIDYATPGAHSGELAEQEMRQYYQSVFSSAEGRKVLGDILVSNHFGVPLNSEVERIEYNVAIAIARMSGIMSEVDSLLGILES